VLAPVRRLGTVMLLTMAALSPWLVNLAQNFRTHLVGRNDADLVNYYDIGPLMPLLTQPVMWLLYVLALVGVLAAIRDRRWILLLPAITWGILGLWSHPYLLSAIAPGFRLPFAGYLDANTLAQGVWLPICILAGYGAARLVEWVVGLATGFRATPARAWQAAMAPLVAVAVGLLGLAAAMPVAARIDTKPYVTTADERALVWMRDNLPRDSYVLANPFAFPWAPNIVYGSDAGLWIPLVSGLQTTVPPLPAYNERPGDSSYLPGIFTAATQYLPVSGRQDDALWQDLKSAGITHVFVGSRGGAIDVPTLLDSGHADVVFHDNAVWVFALQ
jgi:hypothetical protein